MPILPPEPSLYPNEKILLLPSSGDQDGRRWWVAHTQPRQEKALARQLYRQRSAYYLPTEPKRVLVRKKIVISHVPIFSGYLFMWLDEQERARIIGSNHLANILRVDAQERLAADLKNVYRLLDLGQEITREDKIIAGSQVTIREGPLMGMTGTVSEVVTGFRFVVQVDFIQKGIGITIDGRMLGLVQ